MAGGKVLLSEGAFNLADRLELAASNIALVGQGIGITKLTLANGANTNGIYIPSAAYDNLLIAGFELDCNGANQSDGVGRNDRNGIWFVCAGGSTMRDQITLRDLYIHDTRHGEGIAFHDINRGSIERVYCLFNGIHSGVYSGDGIHTAYCIDMMIRDYVGLANDDTGIAQDYNEFTTLVNCICRYNASNQFTFARESKDGIFQGCIAQGGAYGLRTGKFGIGGDGPTTDLIFTDGIIRDATTQGVLVEDHTILLLSNNIFAANVANIGFAAAHTFIVIRDNFGLFTDNSGTSTGTGAQQTIPHYLYTTPNRVYLSDIEQGANAYQSAAADAVNIYITAVLNQDYVWKAEVV